MDGLEYWFGTGDGATTTWTSPADLDIDADGGLDAVRLDFDGDGLVDDAMWDSDGDGSADHAVLDVGAPEARYFVDPTRNGLWAQQISHPEPPGPPQALSAPPAAMRPPRARPPRRKFLRSIARPWPEKKLLLTCRSL